MMKFACKAIAASVLAVATTGVMAAENTALSDAGFTFAGNVALTTDYRYRGITQTFNDPALQGGFVLSHETGLYAGVWGSNVDFGGTAHLELDSLAAHPKEVAP